MSELLPVVLTSMILAVLSHYTSVYERNGMRYVRREWVFYVAMAVVMKPPLQMPCEAVSFGAPLWMWSPRNPSPLPILCSLPLIASSHPTWHGRLWKPGREF